MTRREIRLIYNFIVYGEIIGDRFENSDRDANFIVSNGLSFGLECLEQLMQICRKRIHRSSKKGKSPMGSPCCLCCGKSSLEYDYD